MVYGGISLDVTKDSGGKPVAYGDYIHTWSRPWDNLNFSFILKWFGIAVKGSNKPDFWRAENEMYVR